MPFNVQLNYKIYNKNAVLREAYPKDIRFVYTNTEGTQSVGKRSGGATLRARFAGGKATTNKKLKNIFYKLKNIYYVLLFKNYVIK